MGRDYAPGGLSRNKYLPVSLTVFVFLGVTLPSLRVRPTIYSYDAAVAPYTDTGFRLSPDWSHEPHLLNEGYVIGYTVLLMLFIAFFGGSSSGGSPRVTIFRRFLFTFTCGQLLQLVQMFSTIFPDPNPQRRFLVESRAWAFMMYPVLYAVGVLTVQFYATFKPAIVLAYLLSIFGCALLIPTRYVYTVDMLSALIAGILPFLVYHWYVRTTLSMNKRRFLRWFEQDALDDCNVRGSVTVSLLRGGGAGGVTSSQQRLGYGSDGASPVVKANGGGAAFVSLESPATEFGLHEFRAPTFVGQESENQELELVEMVANMGSNKKRYQYIVSSFGFTAFIGICAAASTFSSLWFTDHERPIGHPLPDDVLYHILPEVPAHTADVFLYIQVGLVALGTLYSSQRLTILRRTGFMFACLFLMRCVTIDATFPPDPSPLCSKATHPPGVTCGDLIFSGHTVCFLLSGFVVRYYCKVWWVEIITWLWTSVGLLAVVACRLHYTRDVITALIVGLCFIHLCYVSIFWRPDRKLKYHFIFWFDFDHCWWMWKEKLEEERKQIVDFTSSLSTTAANSKGNSPVDTSNTGPHTLVDEGSTPVRGAGGRSTFPGDDSSAVSQLTISQATVRDE